MTIISLSNLIGWTTSYNANPWTYILTMIPSITFSSIALAWGAQMFATKFWDPISVNTESANKPSQNIIVNYAINTTIVGILGTIMNITALNNDTLYLEDITLFNITKELLIVIALTLLYDLQTYIYHRASHNLPVLKKMHAIHHEYNIPNGIIAGLYGEIIESTIVASFAMWPISVFHLPLVSVAIYFFIITWFVQLNHSGRKVVIPYLYTYKYHYNHHKLRNCNYCEHLPIYDYLFRTLNLN